MFKRSFCSVIFILCLAFSCVNVFASEGAKFALSDVNVKNNRIFETHLSVKSDAEIAAFVAEIRYDETRVQFRKAKAEDNSFVSVNNSQKGVVRVAFFCEEGINCKNGETPITFSFKSLGKSGSLELSVEQVADTNAKDVLVTDCKNAVLYAEETSDSDSVKNENDTDDSEDNGSELVNEEKTESKADEGFEDTTENKDKLTRLDFASDGGYNWMAVLWIALGALAFLGISAISFVLGRKSRDKK